MPQFTVFCRDSADPNSTIWISSVTATDSQDAIRVGRDECANDWDYREADAIDYDCGNGDIACIDVLGVVEGSIAVIEWDDSGLEIPESTVSQPWDTAI